MGWASKSSLLSNKAASKMRIKCVAINVCTAKERQKGVNKQRERRRGRGSVSLVFAVHQGRSQGVGAKLKTSGRLGYGGRLNRTKA